MKCDCGFWDINDNYIEDIQEISEMEMKEECKFLKDCQCDCTGTDDKVEICEVYRLRENIDDLAKDLFVQNEMLGKLEQDNKELKEEYNNLICEIISDVPFRGIELTNETPLEHLKKCQKALQTLNAIKEIIIQAKVTNNKKLRAILDLIKESEV